MAAEGWFDTELVAVDWFPVDIRAWFDSTLVTDVAATHNTSGSIVGPGSTVTGASKRNSTYLTTGALTGSGSVITGAATHKAKHATTGALTGSGSVVNGISARFRSHAATGVLSGTNSNIVGAANLSPAVIPHVATGSLIGSGSILSGLANRNELIIIDTHDGDYYGKKFKKEKQKEAERRAQIVRAYEIVVEGKPDVAEEISAPFVIEKTENNVIKKSIDFDSMFADINRVEKIFNAYLDLDDEEVLLLI